MSDLISRSMYKSKLIKALDVLNKEYREAILNEDSDLILAIQNQQSAYMLALRLLDNEPTAYDVNKVVEELEKESLYEDLEEQGRVVILPCKDVYFIVDAKTPKYALVMKRSVRDLAIYEIEKVDKKNCKYFSTKEKAEARLKELKGEA